MQVTIKVYHTIDLQRTYYTMIDLKFIFHRGISLVIYALKMIKYSGLCKYLLSLTDKSDQGVITYSRLVYDVE